jgi:tRNA pseudouridine32 synthase / 23S rRNA pseudouridine746 synthase
MIQPVFQNNNFIVCDKPAMVLSVPAREKNDARDCLGLRLEIELQTQIFPVHRLDYEVSGLIIYALNSRAHKISQQWFEQKTIHKLYIANTLLQDFSHWPINVKTDRSILNADEGQEFVWKTQMLRGKRRSFESEHGEWAETHAQVRSHDGSKITWNLYPVTGKSHQLRLELSRRGFPIIGDSLYGSKVVNSRPGIALQAVEIDLSDVKDRLGLPERLFLPQA